MWYILYMNKDVIYIEPEDDITDIILKIENSKEKIVALVPPKKAGVFRSVVNIKLIAKAGVTSGKKIVLVTTDPSINKLAAATKLPVTKNLQSAPAIPVLDEEDDETTSTEELVEESDGTVETEEESEDTKAGEEDKTEEQESDETKEEDEEKEENGSEKKDDKKKDKKTKPSKSNNKFINWIKNNKKLSIALGIGSLALLLFLIWALAIAPAVTITVGIRTESKRFSDSVNFTTKLEDEKLEDSKFFLEEKKIESSQEVKFEATGKKNVGEKASGEVKVYAYFPLNLRASTQVKEGDTFSISGLVYVATKTVVLEYSGNGKEECSNKTNSEGLVDYGCRVDESVPVIASAAGEKYNIAASSSGWSTNARVFAYSDEAMKGGTDQEITIVTQADIDKAKSELAASDQDKNKEELLEKIGDDSLVIDSSFIQKTSDAVSTPAVGEEVKEGVTPTLKATTVASVYVLDKTKVEEFITSKADLSESQKIYEMKDPFIESFLETDSGYTGKLKTTYLVGPKIADNDVIEKVKGKGLGEAKHDLLSIDGVSEVKMDPSLPWVTSVPNNPNKITVIFEVKDQNGNAVETKQETEEKKDEKEEKDEKDSDSKDDKKN